MSSLVEIHALEDRTPAIRKPYSVGFNIGCGDKQIGNSIGLDVRPNAKAAVLMADARELPVRGASLDYIVSCHCLEHLRDGPLPILREWVRCLKPGGSLAVAVPNGQESPDSMLLYQVPRGRTIPGQHVHLFTMETLQSYLRCAGLIGVSAEIVNREPWWHSTVIVASGFRGPDYQESPYRWRAWTWLRQIMKDTCWRDRLPVQYRHWRDNRAAQEFGGK